MSRKIARRFDATEYESLFARPGPPEFMEGVPKATLDESAYKEGSDFNYLVSRARYIGTYNLPRHKARIQQLIISDEMEAFADPIDALFTMDHMYREETRHLNDLLHHDESAKNLSDDAEVRARLLSVYFKRLNEFKNIGSPIFDDLQAILRACSPLANEKHALAQKLIIENPDLSLGKIAEASEDSIRYPELRFDQSCLSQWIAAGIVIDTHANIRPEWGLGRR